MLVVSAEVEADFEKWYRNTESEYHVEFSDSTLVWIRSAYYAGGLRQQQRNAENGGRSNERR